MRSKGMWVILLTLSFATCLVVSAAAQTAPKPVYTGYKGVMIGTTMDEARTKLGNPRDKSDLEDYYVYSEIETCQVQYGPDKTVKLLSINYVGKNAPTPMEILGIELEAKPDGSMNKLVKYPKAGYQISYLKTGGDDPITMITVQRLAASVQ